MYQTNILELKITELGYYYFIDSNHPLATGNSGRVLYHRHIASLNIGRWLNSSEIVHHIDGNKLNNIIPNLEIMSLSEHTALHMRKFRVSDNTCKYCNELFHPDKVTQIYCSDLCANTDKIRIEISREELEVLMSEHSWTSLGKLLGYSDNGIKKRAKALGCDLELIKTSRTSRGRRQSS